LKSRDTARLTWTARQSGARSIEWIHGQEQRRICRLCAKAYMTDP
jgi:hypothetical protein